MNTDDASLSDTYTQTLKKSYCHKQILVLESPLHSFGLTLESILRSGLFVSLLDSRGFQCKGDLFNFKLSDCTGESLKCGSFSLGLKLGEEGDGGRVGLTESPLV